MLSPAPSSSPVLAVALTIALAASAGAQEGFDLRARHVPVVGERTQVREVTEQEQVLRSMSGPEELESVRQQLGSEARYLEEVQAVTPEGEVGRALRTYELVRDLERGESHELSGVQVAIVREPDGRRRFVVEQGEAPPLLTRLLEEELGRPDDPAPAPEEDDPVQDMFPSGPVRAGERWEVPPERAARLFGCDPADLDPAGSSVSGLLETVTREGGVTLLHVTFQVKLALRRFEGLTPPEPVRVEARLKAIRAARGESPRLRQELTGRIQGKLPPPDAPQGVLLHFDVALTGLHEVRLAPQ